MFDEAPVDAGAIRTEDIDEAASESFPASDAPAWTLGTERPTVRVTRDAMGEIDIPQSALYGAQTQRAVENFPISQHRLQPEFLRTLAQIKACSATVNAEFGALTQEQAEAIRDAAETVEGGLYQDQFVVDVFQTGSGTSTNMNMNEVLANLSHTHPNDHVNCSQSSNDVFPAAIHISAVAQTHRELLPAMEELRAALEKKATQFAGIVKLGRTHLQDATPMTLGQVFGGFAHQLQAARERIDQGLQGLYELPLGGTAVGTGMNAPHGFGGRVTALIAERTGLPFREARNHIEAQSSRDGVLFFSAALRSYAVALEKIANDIRWMGSGPRAGLGELRLPAVQAGSSIMPGKINPVILESALMVCAQVMGHDAAIAHACGAGNFQLNTMMPLMAYNLLDSISLLVAVTRNVAARCIEGLEADTQRLQGMVDQSLSLAAALAPRVGYDRAAEIARQAWDEGKTIREIALQQAVLPKEEIDALLAGALGNAR